MRRVPVILPVVVLLSGMGSLIQASSHNRGIAVVPVTTQAGQRVNLYQGSHALLIGVSGYDDASGRPDRESIPGELDRLQQALERNGFSVTRVRNPNSRQLKQALVILPVATMSARHR